VYYRPEQQSIPARIFTTAGWIAGHIRAPQRHRWLDYINNCGHWLKMTDVGLPTQQDPVSFFALSRASAVLIEPTGKVDRKGVADVPVDAIERHVNCLLDVGVISGTLSLRPNIRVSDHLSQKTDFMLLTACSLRLFGRFGEANLEMTMATCFVNATRVIGVSEVDDGEDDQPRDG
jgi:hypothetical protein